MVDLWALKLDIWVTDFIANRSTTTHMLRQTRLPPNAEVAKKINNEVLIKGLL